jgi:hypothetical protein
MSEFLKRRKELAGAESLSGIKKAGPDLSTPSEFMKRRKVLGGTKAILSGVLSKTPVGRAAKMVGAGLGIGAAGVAGKKIASDLSDDESYKEGREEGKKEGSDFKEKVKKEVGKVIGKVSGVIGKKLGGSVFVKTKLGRTKPTKLF